MLKWLDRTAIVAGIFMEWQSTAKMPVWVWDECSSTSGRGIGLHPLSELTQALGARLQLNSLGSRSWHQQAVV